MPVDIASKCGMNRGKMKGRGDSFRELGLLVARAKHEYNRAKRLRDPGVHSGSSNSGTTRRDAQFPCQRTNGGGVSIRAERIPGRVAVRLRGGTGRGHRLVVERAGTAGTSPNSRGPKHDD